MVKPRDHLIQNEQFDQRRAIARKLKPRVKSLPVEVADLEQELVLRLLLAEVTFDPDRGSWESFSSTISTRFISSTIREQLQLSKHEPIQLDQPDEMIDPQQQEDVLLRIDVQKSLIQLPPDLALLARRLMLVSLAEVAREQATPRSTLQRRVDQLRIALKHLKPEYSG
jgi:hypothetical protein